MANTTCKYFSINYLVVHKSSFDVSLCVPLMNVPIYYDLGDMLVNIHNATAVYRCVIDVSDLSLFRRLSPSKNMKVLITSTSRYPYL